MPAVSQAKSSPVRPKPVITSSAISGTPAVSQIRRAATRKSAECMTIPAAPCTRGSTITPARRCPSLSTVAASSSSSGPTRATSKSSGSKARKKGSGSPTAIAPKVSPW